jgi:hypothetical protein
MSYFVGVDDLLASVSYAAPDYEYVNVDLDARESPEQLAWGRRVAWLLDSVNVVEVPVEKVAFTELNPFNFGQVAALRELIVSGRAPIFRLPVARFYRIDPGEAEETRREEEDGELEYQRSMSRPWDDDDEGSFYVQLTDGNHRVLAAMAAGEPTVFIAFPSGYKADVLPEELVDVDVWGENPQPHWRELTSGNVDHLARWVSEPQIASAVSRALRAGAIPPLDYQGAGASGIVFCDQRGRAFKVSRYVTDSAREFFAREAAYLRAAKASPRTAGMVPHVFSWRPDLVVIERECVRGEAPSWQEPWQDWHRSLSVSGWTKPEAKDDSWIVTEQGPVLVDAGYALRRGPALADHVEAVLTGRAQGYGESLKDMAWAIYVDRNQGWIHPERAAEVLAQLRAAGDTSEWSGPSKQNPQSEDDRQYALFPGVDFGLPIGPQAGKLGRLVLSGQVDADWAQQWLHFLDPFAETGFDHHMVEMLRKAIALRSGRLAFNEAIEGARNLHVRTKRGMELMIHPGVQDYAPPGSWQVSRFYPERARIELGEPLPGRPGRWRFPRHEGEAALMPAGHSYAPSLEEAVNQAWNEYGALELIERANPGDEGLRDLERRALAGGPEEMARHVIELKRRGLPVETGSWALDWLLQHELDADIALDANRPGGYTPTPNVLASRYEHRYVDRVRDLAQTVVVDPRHEVRGFGGAYLDSGWTVGARGAYYIGAGVSGRELSGLALQKIADVLVEAGVPIQWEPSPIAPSYDVLYALQPVDQMQQVRDAWGPYVGILRSLGAAREVHAWEGS